MLDIDLALTFCPDELFDLPAPAAMGRSIAGAYHGTKLNHRGIFAGEIVEPGHTAWGQHGGINAGVMLLEPNEREYMSALREVQTPLHPERIPGSGPEQDYLSRLFAPYWTHISASWNYQLHRTFHALEAEVYHAAVHFDLAQSWTPESMSIGVEDIRIFHFSGTLKMWQRDYQDRETDESFAKRLLRDYQDFRYRMWVDREGSQVLTARHNRSIFECIADVYGQESSLPATISVVRVAL